MKNLFFLFLFLPPSFCFSQNYFNRLIDVYPGLEQVYEAEIKNGYIYTRGIDNNYKRVISLFDGYGNLINSIKFNAQTFYGTSLDNKRTLEFVDDSLLIFNPNTIEKKIELNIYNLELDSLAKKEIIVDPSEEAYTVLLPYILQNEDYFFAIGAVRYFPDEFEETKFDGMIAKINKSTFEVDTMITHAIDSFNTTYFQHPLIDAEGNLSISYECKDLGFGGLRHSGVVKFDEDLNEVPSFETSLYFGHEPGGHHWELPNGNIVFEEKSFDTQGFGRSDAALECYDSEGNTIWRRQEFIVGVGSLSTTQWYEDAIINQEGNLVLASYNSNNYFSWEMRVQCISAESGELLWDRYLQNPEDSLIHTNPAPLAGMLQLENGDLLLYGEKDMDSTNVFPPNYGHWLMKLDAYGCLEPGCQFSSTENFEENKYPSFTISPNPARYEINIELPEGDFEQRSGKLQVVDLIGRVVISGNIFSSSKKLDIHGFPSGLYYCRIVYEEENEVYISSFVIQ